MNLWDFMLSFVPIGKVDMLMLVLSSWWLATHSGSHLLGFRIGVGGGVHRGSVGSSSVDTPVITDSGDCLVCVSGVLVDCVLLVFLLYCR